MIRQLSTSMGLGNNSSHHGSQKNSKKGGGAFMDEEDVGSAAPLASIEGSSGWWPLPQSKLASWDPEDEIQWNVRYVPKCRSFLFLCAVDKRALC